MSPKSELDSEQSISQSVLSSRDVFARSDDHGPLEAVVNQLSDKLTEVSADVQAMKNSHSADIQTLLNAHNTDIQALKNTDTQQDIAIQEAGSSVYVRWGNEDQNGKLLYFTVAECGSLPCDPYTSNKIVTCAVCSK
nr:hypothetical protein BaRGS_014619 [Batillaria attramentaria]